MGASGVRGVNSRGAGQSYTGRRRFPAVMQRATTAEETYTRPYWEKEGSKRPGTRRSLPSCCLPVRRQRVREPESKEQRTLAGRRTRPGNRKLQRGSVQALGRAPDGAG